MTTTQDTEERDSESQMTERQQRSLSERMAGVEAQQELLVHNVLQNGSRLERLETKIDTNTQQLNDKIDTNTQQLNDKIPNTQQLNDKIDTNYHALNDKIDTITTRWTPR